MEDGLSLVMRDIFNKDVPQSERVYRTTMEILSLLSSSQTKATFFTLGIVAEKYPQLIKEITDEGHELAVHGHNHYRFFQMNKKNAYLEIKRAKDTLEQVSGVAMKGHRAPAFSISKHTPWAFEVLAKLGFIYDSSIMPRKSKYNGWSEFPTDITEVKTPYGLLTEFPITTISFGSMKLPFSGGGYLRLLPLWFLRRALHKIITQKPAVLYVHPYEFDREPYPSYYFDEMKKLPLKTRIKLRTNFWNRKKSAKKMTQLLEQFSFDRMDRVISQASNKKKIFTP